MLERRVIDGILYTAITPLHTAHDVPQEETDKRINQIATALEHALEDENTKSFEDFRAVLQPWSDQILTGGSQSTKETLINQIADAFTTAVNEIARKPPRTHRGITIH